MSKTINTKLKPEKSIKKRTPSKEPLLTPVTLIYLGEFRDIYSGENKIITQRFIDEEAKKLIAWALTPEALLVQDFYDGRGYGKRRFYEWVEKYPIFADAHEFCLSRIGSRRELGAMNKAFDVSTIHRTLGYYQSIWKSETIEQIKMREDVSNPNETKVVVIEKFALPDDNLRYTPEEVAQIAHQMTKQDRLTGPLQYKKREIDAQKK